MIAQSNKFKRPHPNGKSFYNFIIDIKPRTTLNKLTHGRFLLLVKEEKLHILVKDLEDLDVVLSKSVKFWFFKMSFCTFK